MMKKMFALLLLCAASFAAVTGGDDIFNITNSSGTYTVHQFYGNGTFDSSFDIENAIILVVGGGGGGGSRHGGGGGAGAFILNLSYNISAGTYPVTVGLGGLGSQDPVAATSGISGQNSSFDIFVAEGGGCGGSGPGPACNGGSGGGGGGSNPLGQGNATGSYGHDGGNGTNNAAQYLGAGGGGAGGAGTNATLTTTPGTGGAGLATTINGTSSTYAAGGDGGQFSGTVGADATNRTGDGGGGSGNASNVGGNGGSGIVIIAYDANQFAGISVVQINVTPNNATAARDIGCTVNATSPINATFEIEYEWYLNGTNQTTLAGSTNPYFNNSFSNVSIVSSSLTTENDEWSCRARAYDGTDYSSWLFSSNITISALPSANITNLTLTLLTPLNATNASTPVNFTWDGLTADDYFYNVTYQLCINASSNYTQVCYVGINQTWYNISLNTGVVALWKVRGFDGIEYSNYSDTWQFVVNSTAVFPAGQTLEPIDTIFFTYAWDTRFFTIPLLAAGAAAFAFSTLAGSALGLGSGLLFTAVIFRTGDLAADVTIGGFAVVVLAIGFALKNTGNT